MMNKMIDCGLVNRIERSGYTNLYTVNPIEQNDTAAKSVAEEVKMNQVLLLEIKHKALSIQIAQQRARLRIHTTLALLGLTIVTAPSLNNLHSLHSFLL